MQKQTPTGFRRFQLDKSCRFVSSCAYWHPKHSEQDNKYKLNRSEATKSWNHHDWRNKQTRSYFATSVWKEKIKKNLNRFILAKVEMIQRFKWYTKSIIQKPKTNLRLPTWLRCLNLINVSPQRRRQINKHMNSRHLKESNFFYLQSLFWLRRFKKSHEEEA